jgi:hypothetical protein
VGQGQVVARARVLVHKVVRAEELAERRRARIVDLVLAARGLVLKHVDVAELRVVVAAVLAVAADAVLVTHHLPNLGAQGAHLVTAMARLHVQNLAQGSSLEAGKTREKKGGKERSNAKNSLRQFGTGKRKCRWRARLYPERETEVV